MLAEPAEFLALMEPLRSELEYIDAVLEETLGGVEEPLGSALRRAVSGGKRLRAALVVLTGQMFKVDAPPFHRLAAALEMLHAATLIHDDVIDGAATRRGDLTLHQVWPTSAAILAGDYLLAQAAALIADLGCSHISRSFAGVLTAMCAGEIRQALVTPGRPYHREDYYRSIEAKTGSLFAGSMEMAGLLAAAEQRQIDGLRRFGRLTGLAFQITDDILDLVGDEGEMGKTPGSDLRQGLITLPTVLYLEQADRGTAVHAVLSGARDAEHVQAAIVEIGSSGTIERAHAEALRHVREAQAALEILPSNLARGTMSALAEYVVARRR
jgi:geranylgeranyl pyrophosphate synthase